MVITSYRRLPHIDSNGDPQFLTFRLFDSLPPNRYFAPASVTSGRAFVRLDNLLDQARSGPTFLGQPSAAEVVANSLQHGTRLGQYELHAWVIMPNHVHLLLTPLVPLSRLLCSLKTASAKEVNRILNRTGRPFWQNESYDHLVRSAEEFRRVERYIENNPVKAGLVATPEEYWWSSGRRPERSPQAKCPPY